MLVFGDLACPSAEYADKLILDMQKYNLIGTHSILCNLEGIIRDDCPYEDEKLFNHSKVLGAFDCNRTVFSLANNHTYDYPDYIEKTESKLNQKGFKYIGIAGDEFEPALINEGNTTYAIFTHCWKVYTETNPNVKNKKRIVDYPYIKFLKKIEDYISHNPHNKVICYFHWNYDLEILPFPAYRKLARRLIDLGVFAVLGNHSHVPQGGEVYKDRVIVYGLGNFFIPSGKFFGGELSYPDQSKKMMVLEIHEKINDVKCHWFATDDGECLRLINSESFLNGNMITSISPYRGMSDKNYLAYFKKNRIKRKLVPVFNHFYGPLYSINEFAAIVRIKIIKKIKSF